MGLRIGWFHCTINQLFPSFINNDKVTLDRRTWH